MKVETKTIILIIVCGILCIFLAIMIHDTNTLKMQQDQEKESKCNNSEYLVYSTYNPDTKQIITTETIKSICRSNENE